MRWRAAGNFSLRNTPADLDAPPSVRRRSSAPISAVERDLELDLGGRTLRAARMADGAYRLRSDRLRRAHAHPLDRRSAVSRALAGAWMAASRAGLCAIDELARDAGAAAPCPAMADRRTICRRHSRQNAAICMRCVDGVRARAGTRTNRCSDAIEHVAAAEKPHWLLWDERASAQRGARLRRSSSGNDAPPRVFLQAGRRQPRGAGPGRARVRGFCAAAEAHACVVVGGGFAGARCALELRRLDPALDVTLVDPRRALCHLSDEQRARWSALRDSQSHHGVARRGSARAGVRCLREPGDRHRCPSGAACASRAALSSPTIGWWWRRAFAFCGASRRATMQRRRR